MANAIRRKTGTIGSLAEAYFASGVNAVRRVIDERIELEGHEVAVGRLAHRTDVGEGEGISYIDHSPTFWEVPYSILLATFEPGNEKKDLFIYHNGEEVIVPVSKGTGIKYHYFWGAERNKPTRNDELPPVRRGELFRVNPQIPHHTWAEGSDTETAWMVIHHVSDSPNAITLTAQSQENEAKLRTPREPRKVTTAELEDPARYALIAWGIAEKVRLFRTRAGLSITQMSEGCGVNASQLSRLENADGNLSLDTLKDIAKFLRMDLRDLRGPFPEFHRPTQDRTTFPLEIRSAKRKLLLQDKSPKIHHHLLFVGWTIPKGELRTDCGDHRELTSWIVLDGTVRFEPERPSGLQFKYLVAGQVIHFFEDVPKTLQAVEDARVLQVSYQSIDVR